MQIARENIENLFVNMVLGKKLLKDTNSKSHISMYF
jgi:hypothetical protein